MMYSDEILTSMLIILSAVFVIGALFGALITYLLV